jgi:hypothetical protein
MKKILFCASLLFVSSVGFYSCKAKSGHHGGVHTNFCLTGDTKIAMQNGSSLELSKLHTGDLVLSYNASTRQVESATVLEMKSVKHDNLMLLSFETAQVKITDDHPVWVKGKGWSSFNPERTMQYMKLDKVSLLQEGDICMFLDNNGQTGESRLMKAAELSGEFKTYTITKMSRNTMFFANGIIVGVEELKPTTL